MAGMAGGLWGGWSGSPVAAFSFGLLALFSAVYLLVRLLLRYA